MSSFLWLLGVYLVIGAAVIVLLNALTNGRIFRNFQDAVYNGQDIVVSRGIPAGLGTMRVVMVGAVLLFWPALVVGAVERKLKGKKEEDN